ncbi:MAG: EFR1 family ferrodoxin [Clostridiales bacterium]
MIFYFSGSGNSLYVAQWLGDALDEPLLAVAEERKKKHIRYYPAVGERVIFVMPVYFFGLPAIIDDFVRRMEFYGEQIIPVYVILTCGDSSGDAGGKFKRLLRRQDSCQLMGVYALKMPDNYILGYTLAKPEKQQKILVQAEQRLPLIKEAILTGKQSAEITRRGIFPRLLTLTAYRIYVRGRHTKKFYVNENCTGCGLCAQICPIGAIEMENGKPRWIKNRCNHCLACLHRCPKQASQYGKSTAKRGRYTHPQADFSLSASLSEKDSADS